MDERITGKFAWVEPAQMSVVRQYNDLVKLYSIIKSKYQKGIDSAFDKVSSQVGFVVTTALPVTLEVDSGKVKGLKMGSENLKGSLFEKEITTSLRPMMDESLQISNGVYNLILFWKDALMIGRVVVPPEPAQLVPEVTEMLRRVHPEPAHYWAARDAALAVQALRMPPPEPVQFIKILHDMVARPSPDPWRANVLVSAIDEVYPELRISQRLADSKATLARAESLPLIRHEPVHYARDDLGEQQGLALVLSEMAAVLRKYGY